jgi:MerR family transcriptional regulator, copper efflux regulator
MKIGELARAAGIAASRIRFYERHGLLQTAARSDNGYRDYPSSAVDTLGFIRQAQGLGFSLAEIKQAMPGSVEGIRACDSALGPLCKKLIEVDEQIRLLTERREVMIDLISRLQARSLTQNRNQECRRQRATG